MRHPFFWGVVVGAGGLYLLGHFMTIPRVNRGG